MRPPTLPDLAPRQLNFNNIHVNVSAPAQPLSPKPTTPVSITTEKQSQLLLEDAETEAEPYRSDDNTAPAPPPPLSRKWHHPLSALSRRLLLLLATTGWAAFFLVLLFLNPVTPPPRTHPYPWPPPPSRNLTLISNPPYPVFVRSIADMTTLVQASYSCIPWDPYLTSLRPPLLAAMERWSAAVDRQDQRAETLFADVIAQSFDLVELEMQFAGVLAGPGAGDMWWRWWVHSAREGKRRGRELAAYRKRAIRHIEALIRTGEGLEEVMGTVLRRTREWVDEVAGAESEVRSMDWDQKLELRGRDKLDVLPEGVAMDFGAVVGGNRVFLQARMAQVKAWYDRVQVMPRTLRNMLLHVGREVEEENLNDQRFREEVSRLHRLVAEAVGVVDGLGETR
jgi:hypothetical protein